MSSLTVIDDDRECQICNSGRQCDRDTVIIDACKHIYHIGCLINHTYENGLQCPVCKSDIHDRRLSIAIAFKEGSVTSLIECLTEK